MLVTYERSSVAVFGLIAGKEVRIESLERGEGEEKEGDEGEEREIRKRNSGQRCQAPLPHFHYICKSNRIITTVKS